jgi:hypothetical protein
MFENILLAMITPSPVVFGDGLLPLPVIPYWPP